MANDIVPLRGTRLIRTCNGSAGSSRVRAPKGRSNLAQGNALGRARGTPNACALKGRAILPRVVRPFRAQAMKGPVDPGQRPGLNAGNRKCVRPEGARHPAEVVRPFRAQAMKGPVDPGRCPGLD